MQYFLKRAIINKDLILQLCSLLKIIIQSSWAINNIYIGEIAQFISIVKPLYRPYFAQRFIDPICSSSDPRPHILIVMRHILQQEGSYELNTRERYRTGIGRFIEYSIGMRNMILDEPIELNFSDKE